MQQLFTVYAADGAFFDKVRLPQAELLMDHNAVRIEGKRRITLRLTVETSAAKALLAPRFPASQKTFLVERIGEQRSALYQHNHRRCEGFKGSIQDLIVRLQPCLES